MRLLRLPRANRSHKGRLSSLIVMVVVCGVACGALNAHAQPAFDREYQIKVAILYNSLKFVEWPAEALLETSPTITICVLGEDPFGTALDSIRGKVIKGRALAIRRLERSQDPGGCHVLFIGSSEKTRLTQIVQSLKDARVLTIGETPQFAELGGIISLTIEKNNVRFVINADSAERAGLKVSSELLKLATVVREAH